MNNHVASVKSEVIIDDNSSSSMLKLNSCSFPYYRSFKGSCHDSVLVKDIGINCELLKVTKTRKTRGKLFTIKDYDIKQSKSFYCDDNSSITRRISSYTRGMLNNLTMKISRKQYFNNKKENIGNIPIATEYYDEEGKPSLKLRIFNAKNCHQLHKNSVNSLEILSDKGSKSNLQIIFPPTEINHDRPSSSPSTFSLYSYLTTGKTKSSNDEFKTRNPRKSTTINDNHDKSRHTAAILNDWWSNINLNTVNIRIIKSKRNH